MNARCANASGYPLPLVQVNHFRLFRANGFNMGASVPVADKATVENVYKPRCYLIQKPKAVKSMLESSKNVQSIEELRQYIADTLSQLETLKSDQLELTQQTLYRAGRPCGMYFCLHGPRALRLTAIWETESNSVLFYGSCGRRVQRTRLMQALAIDAYATSLSP